MTGRLTASLFLLLTLLMGLGGCATGVQVAPVGSQSYEPTTSVAVLTAKPARPFTVIGRFSGHLSIMCPTNDRYCKIRKRAMALGGDAIWIQRTDVTHYPDRWIMVKGQLTHIYASQDTRIAGVIVRYKRSGVTKSSDDGTR